MNWQKYAPITLRLGLAAAFLWFGLNQAFNPDAWLVWMPQWAQQSDRAIALLLGNAALEITLGTMLAVGFYTRKVAFLLALHMLSIIAMLGYGDLAVRDFITFIGCTSVFLHGPDEWCLVR